MGVAKEKASQTFSFIRWVVFCPGFGAACMDCKYAPKGKQDPETNPYPAYPECKKASSRNDMIAAVIMLLLKPLVAWFIWAFYVPLIWGAKYMLAFWCAMIIGLGCLVTVILIALHCCCPQTVEEVKSPPLIDTFLNVVDLKTGDAAERKKEGIKWVFKKGCKYLRNTFTAICKCAMMKPSSIWTFSKVMFALLITEVFMACSVWAYILSRFIIGTFTWTLLSFEWWLKELLCCNAIKNRIMFLNYEAWMDGSAGGEANRLAGLLQPIPAMDCCMVTCCLSCCKLPGCPKCPTCPTCPTCCGCKCCGCCDCKLVCDFCCTMCSIGLDIFDGIISAFLIIGKATQYTERMLELASQVRSDVEQAKPGAPKQAWTSNDDMKQNVPPDPQGAEDTPPQDQGSSGAAGSSEPQGSAAEGSMPGAPEEPPADQGLRSAGSSEPPPCPPLQR